MQKVREIELKVRFPHHIYYCTRMESMCDCITVLNLSVSQFDFVLVSKHWYRSIVSADLLDSCCFDIRVSQRTHIPLTPIPYEVLHSSK